MSQSTHRNIRPLEKKLREKLRSSIAITSYAQCVEELVLNALDAGATCIAVRVHIANSYIYVIDNGRGMTKRDMETVGKRYHSSKCHTLMDVENLTYFGYRGEALASIRETCRQLEIESRIRNDPSTHVLKFKAGEFYSLTEKEPRSSGGSSIFVDGLFYNLPVRKKMIKENIEMEQIRLTMEAHALIHNKVSFTLRNDTNGAKLLQTHKCSGMLGSFTSIYGSKKADSLEKISAAKENFTVDGYISTQSYKNKNLQFVYVNRRLVLRTKIHKTMNFFLKRSLICKKFQTDENGALKRENDRHPYYIINIDCPLAEYDITFEPRKTLVAFKHWRVLSQCLEDMLHLFLQRQGLGYGVDSLEHILAQSSTSSSSKDIPPTRTKDPATDITVNDLLHKITTRCARQTTRVNDNQEDEDDKREMELEINDREAGNIEIQSSEDDLNERCMDEDDITMRKREKRDFSAFGKKRRNVVNSKVATIRKKDLMRNRSGKIIKEKYRDKSNANLHKKRSNKSSMFGHLHKLHEKLKKMSPPKKLPGLCQQTTRGNSDAKKLAVKLRDNNRKRSENGNLDDILVSDDDDSSLRAFSPKKRKYNDNRKSSFLTSKYHRSREIMNEREQAMEQYKLYKRRVAKYLFAPSVISHNVKQETTEIIKRRREKIERKSTKVTSPTSSLLLDNSSSYLASDKENDERLSRRRYFPKLPDRLREEQDTLLAIKRTQNRTNRLKEKVEYPTDNSIPKISDDILYTKVACAMNEYLVGEKTSASKKDKEDYCIEFMTKQKQTKRNEGEVSLENRLTNNEEGLTGNSDLLMTRNNYESLEVEFKQIEKQFKKTYKSMENDLKRTENSIMKSDDSRLSLDDEKKISKGNEFLSNDQSNSKDSAGKSNPPKMNDEILWSKIAVAFKECFIKTPKDCSTTNIIAESDQKCDSDKKDDSFEPPVGKLEDTEEGTGELFIDTEDSEHDKDDVEQEKSELQTDCSNRLKNLDINDDLPEISPVQKEVILDKQDETEISPKGSSQGFLVDNSYKDSEINNLPTINLEDMSDVQAQSYGPDEKMTANNTVESNDQQIVVNKPKYDVKSLRSTMKRNLSLKIDSRSSNLTKGYLFKRKQEEKEKLNKELFTEIADDNLSDKWKDGCIPISIAAMSDEKLKEAWGKVKDPCFNIPKLRIKDISIGTKDQELTTFLQNITGVQLDSKILKETKVIGQVDEKFIVISSLINHFGIDKELILIVDQHAAHERIRLEYFTKEAWSNGKLRNVSVSPPITLELNSKTVRMISSFSKQLEHFGVEFEEDTRDTIILHSLPAALVEKVSNESQSAINVSLELVESFLEDEIEV
ncbi:DgyrCDS9061 [Dimorphilus gyrociliatus]|uniref:DgyrCDS9061 n=1 Tax=Dimorphilus gyrociliatus TaxID=2664684 RepID=A0A7I8VW98_9ANNE|nr:DgyrCDS9061 [Dimorphilus gyrociliatus]